MSESMPAPENSRRVALILARAFGEECIPLQEQMPVWIIDTPKNRTVVEKIRGAQASGESKAITTFEARELETAGSTCERILQSLDDHHNEHSQTPGYSVLIVVGVSLGDISLKPFLELDFSQFEQTPTGFIARKSKL